MFIWQHSSGRWKAAFLVALLGLALGAGLLLLGKPAAALALCLWVIFTLHAQLYPWYCKHVPHGSAYSRAITLFLLAAPIVFGFVHFAAVRAPWLGLSAGLLLGVGLLALSGKDVLVLLHPQMIVTQPAMSFRHAVGETTLSVLGTVCEEMFFRVYLLQVFAVLIGPGAIILSTVCFSYGDWAGSWGPASNFKKWLRTLVLGLGLSGIYFFTGSLWGILLAHMLHNIALLLLPSLNVLVHRHMRQEQSEYLEIS